MNPIIFLSRIVQCAVLTIMLALSACNAGFSDIVVPRIESDAIYWQLSINYQAINLSVAPPHNTVQLHAIPKNAHGVTLPDWDGVVTWQVLDTAKLRIDSTGNLVALGTGSSMRVIATLQIEGVTHTDTALVKVTATAPTSPLQSLSIDPPGGEYTFAQGESQSIRPVANSELNGRITNLQIAYLSLDSTLATVKSSGTTNAIIQGRNTGKVTIVANTYAYGVYANDSVTCNVTIYKLRMFDIVLKDRIMVYPDSIVIGAGGTVMLRDRDGRWGKSPAPSVIFEQPEKALRSLMAEMALVQPVGEEGNIPSRILQPIPFSYSYLGIREFHEAGVYTFRVGADSTKGKIVVVDE